MDTTTVIGTIKDSGVIGFSFNFEESEQEDHQAKLAVQDENCQGIYYNKKHCHKQIQTERGGDTITNFCECNVDIKNMKKDEKQLLL